jgi:hypothetical protein
LTEPGARFRRRESGENEFVPFYDAPKETPEQKDRRLHLMATLGGSLAPKGRYGLPSEEQVARSRAERRAWSRQARVAWTMYWIGLVALFAAGVAGLATGTPWLFVAAASAGLVVLAAGIATGIRADLRQSRRRRTEQRSQSRR